MTGALAALSGALAVTAILFALRSPETKVVDRVVYRDAPAPQRVALSKTEEASPQAALLPSPPSAPQGEYLRLRQAVLERGLDALPMAPSASAASDGLDDLLPSLGRPAGAPPATDRIHRRWFINGDRS